MRTHNYYEVKIIWKIPLCPECGNELNVEKSRKLSAGAVDISCNKCGLKRRESTAFNDRYKRQKFQTFIPVRTESEIRMYEEFRRN